MKSTYKRSLFIDSSNIDEIKKWNSTGTIDGVTTNQVIMLKDGIKPKDFDKTVKAICKEMKNKSVSIELSDSTQSEEVMIKEAIRVNSFAKNITIKVPLIPESTKSLNVICELQKLNISLNITTMMTFEQLVVATLATRYSQKNSFISLFWGRTIEDHQNYRSKLTFTRKNPIMGKESDVNATPSSITKSVANFIKEGEYMNPKIIVGSVRNASMVGEAFAAGANIVTVSPQILMKLLFSQRSIETITQFDDAWKEIQRK